MADSKLNIKPENMDFEIKRLEKTIFGETIGLWVIIYKDEFYFFGNEITEIFDFKNPRGAIRNNTNPRDIISLAGLLGKDYKSTIKQYFQGRLGKSRPCFFHNIQPHQKLLNEFAFYSVCLGSKKECVLPFRDWVYQTIVTIRKTGSYTLPGGAVDNPLDMIAYSSLQVPKYKEGGDNSLRKQMCKAFKEAYNEAKNPYNVKAGRKGGKETQKRIKELKDSFEKLREKVEKSIKKVEIEIETFYNEMASSDESESRSSSYYSDSE